MLCKLEFDIAEYTNMGENELEIKFEFDRRDAVLEADIEFVRN